MSKLQKFLLIAILFISSIEVRAETIPTVSNQYFLDGYDIHSITIKDIADLYGQPLSTSVSGVAYTKYKFNGFLVTSLCDTCEVNSIIIYDQSYTDANGISVGDHKSKINKKIPAVNLKTDKPDLYIADKENKIIYWFRNYKVSKIVLAPDMI